MTEYLREGLKRFALSKRPADRKKRGNAKSLACYNRRAWFSRHEDTTSCHRHCTYPRAERGLVLLAVQKTDAQAYDAFRGCALPPTLQYQCFQEKVVRFFFYALVRIPSKGERLHRTPPFKVGLALDLSHTNEHDFALSSSDLQVRQKIIIASPMSKRIFSALPATSR